MVGRINLQFWKKQRGTHSPSPPVEDTIFAGCWGFSLCQGRCIHTLSFPRGSNWSSFHGQRNWNSERLNDLNNDTQLSRSDSNPSLSLKLLFLTTELYNPHLTPSIHPSHSYHMPPVSPAQCCLMETQEWFKSGFPSEEQSQSLGRQTGK